MGLELIVAFLSEANFFLFLLFSLIPVIFVVVCLRLFLLPITIAILSTKGQQIH
jgi:hypothetical protein